MSEKKDLKKDWKGFFKKVEKYLKIVWKKLESFWKLLKKWKILKFCGAFLVAISGILIFIETIVIGLLHGKPEKFSEIFNYYFGINFFEFVSLKNFQLITGGGYLIDLSIFLTVLFFGIYLWNKKNYFKKRFTRIFLAITLGLGILVFMVSFYNAMPKILIPLEKIEQFCEKKELLEKYKKNNWEIEKRRFKNGFEERGYLRDRNLDAMYYNFFKSF